MKRKVAILILTMLLVNIGMTVGANEVAVIQDTEATQDVEERISDHIEMKYRYHNGHLQYRRWNATQGYWVDPYWKNMT